MPSLTLPVPETGSLVPGSGSQHNPGVFLNLLTSSELGRCHALDSQLVAWVGGFRFQLV